MPIEPNKKLLADPRVPRIKIDDEEWPIPKMALEQIAIVLPLAVENMPKIEDKSVLSGVFSGEILRNLGTVVFLALQRGHKDLTREEFDQMPLGLFELLDAIHVVLQQCGIFRPRKPSEVNGVVAPLAVAATSRQTA